MTKYLKIVESEPFAFVKGEVYIAISTGGRPIRVRCRQVEPPKFSGNLDSSGGFVYQYPLNRFEAIMQCPE